MFQTPLRIKLASLIALASLTVSRVFGQPLDTAFVYQCELREANVLASGDFDLRFRLFGAETSGTQLGPTLCFNDLTIVDGRITVELDFGNQFNGQKRYVEVLVRRDPLAGCAEDAGFEFLSPRQEITITPHAAFALTAANASTATNATQLNGQSAAFYTTATNLTSGLLPNARLGGSYTSIVNLTNASNLISGNGVGLTNLNGSNLASGTVNDSRLSTNVALLAGTQSFSGNKTFVSAPSFAAPIQPFTVVSPGLVPNLNADLLDGQHGAFYSDAGNLTGELSEARLPSSVLSRLPTSQIKVSLLGEAGAGDSWRVHVAGSRAYVAGTFAPVSFRYYDISSAIPGLIGTQPLDGASLGNAQVIAAGGTTVYAFEELVVSGGPPQVRLRVYDTATATPIILHTSPGVAATDAAVSGTSLLSLWNNQLVVRDVSNPAAPVQVGTIATDASPTRIIVDAMNPSTCYVSCLGTGRVMAFSIANPGAPTLLGAMTLGSGEIATSGGYVYAAAAGGALAVGDFRVPSAPVFVTSLSVGATVRQVSVSGSVLWIVSDTTPGSSAALTHFDISAPSAPVQRDSLNAGFPIISVAATGRRVIALAYQNNFHYLKCFASDSIGFAEARFTAGSLAGEGSAIQGLSASNISSGTLNSSLLAGEVARTDSSQTFIGRPSFNGGNSGSTSPFTVDSTTKVVSLNADLLDGLSSTDFANASHTHSAADITSGTLADASIPATVPRLSAAMNTFSNSMHIGESAAAAIRLRVEGSGEVGDPQWSGVGPLAVFESSTNSEISLLSFATNPRKISFRSEEDVANGEIRFLDSEGLTFRMNGGSAAMTVTPLNRVGIGTATPGTNRLRVEGNISGVSIDAALKAFKIDHPLDPENKFLMHSCVESPDMLNLYSGNVTTDEHGYAEVTLPEYFEALNRDFRYQLTVIDDSDEMDTFLWAKVLREVKNNRFTIRSNRGGLKVSWLITGIRKDAFAEMLRITPEVPKSSEEKGKYLHPAAFGKPTEMGIHSNPHVSEK